MLYLIRIQNSLKCFWSAVPLHCYSWCRNIITQFPASWCTYLFWTFNCSINYFLHYFLNYEMWRRYINLPIEWAYALTTACLSQHCLRGAGSSSLYLLCWPLLHLMGSPGREHQGTGQMLNTQRPPSSSDQRHWNKNTVGRQRRCLQSKTQTKKHPNHQNKAVGSGHERATASSSPWGSPAPPSLSSGGDVASPEEASPPSACTPPYFPPPEGQRRFGPVSLLPIALRHVGAWFWSADAHRGGHRLHRWSTDRPPSDEVQLPRSAVSSSDLIVRSFLGAIWVWSGLVHQRFRCLPPPQLIGIRSSLTPGPTRAGWELGRRVAPSFSPECWRHLTSGGVQRCLKLLTAPPLWGEKPDWTGVQYERPIFWSSPSVWARCFYFAVQLEPKPLNHAFTLRQPFEVVWTSENVLTLILECGIWCSKCIKCRKTHWMRMWKLKVDDKTLNVTFQ